MHEMTTLGLNERVERVLAYAFFWVSGIFLFIFEKNRNVRWHAAQSMVTFGGISLLMFVVSMLEKTLAWIPLLGTLTSLGLNLFSDILFWAMIILWGWLMFMAWHRPDYSLPYVSNWVRYFL